MIEPCRWVHTIGMRFPIDVAYVDHDGTVIKTIRMARHRVGLPVPKARWVDRGVGRARSTAGVCGSVTWSRCATSATATSDPGR